MSIFCHDCQVPRVAYEELRQQVNALGKENQGLAARVKELEGAARLVFNYDYRKLRQYPPDLGKLVANLYLVTEQQHRVWDDQDDNSWAIDSDEGDR